jgi:3-oxoacyl-[acyl-carrier protein] reductase
LSFQDKKYVIVGASGGIGSAVARALHEAGAEVLLVGRSAEKLAGLADELGRTRTEVADATIPADLEGAVARFAPIDGIVNCAGSILLKPVHLTTEAEWKHTIDANLTTAYSAVRAGVKAMPNGGSIVLCATAAARTGIANHEAIAAAKGGVIGLTLSAAATYAPRNIRVNCVAPGLVDTPLSAKITSSETALKTSTAMHPLGRIGKPEDVASGIAWLLDPRNTWVTGQVLGIDGGLGSVRAR